jgi:hypothetical protein
MNIGFDYDGTITKNPHLFKEIILAFQLSGHEIYIITGTVENLRTKLNAELIEFGIDPESIKIIMKPSAGDLKDVTTWKCGQIDILKIRCFFENKSYTAKKINSLCTTLKIL